MVRPEPARAGRHALAAAFLLALIQAVSFLVVPSAQAVTTNLGEMADIVAAAARQSPPWDGPGNGPAGQRDKSIAVVCEDLQNGGVLGVARGIEEAAGVMGWRIRIHDARGTGEGRARALADALAQNPDGLALVGMDAGENRARLLAASRRGLPVVGWHVGPRAGPLAESGVAMNVSTDPLQVARVAAMAAVVESGGQAGVVIFTDSNFEIAMAKANAMADIVRSCRGCTLLEIRDVAISRAGERMPDVTRALLAKYGRRWTHGLAINDIYFDYAVPELIRARRPNGSLSLISAGDGSSAAFLRIQAQTFQTGTVAEPLVQQGWQLVDELNRLFARQAVSGYVAPVHLVTPQNVSFDGGVRMQYDPANGYRDIYRRFWGR